jgi:predicted O-linked N-acetylglucosamine transferase (SPINDLY family)
MSFAEHMAVYNDIDIALDTHPWNGHTTTCHALWMGCPVIAKWGNRHAARMSGGVLAALGLKDLVAEDDEEFAEIAIRLASNTGYLEALRANMRQRMLSSPLCDRKAFQVHLEAAYLKMWERWCRMRIGH